MTTTTEYAVITQRDYYGATTGHTLDSLHNTADKARAAKPEWDGPIEMSHNQSGESTGVYAVLQDIEPGDWGTWPDKMVAAACEIARDNGIDPKDSDAVDASEINYEHLSAEAINCALVCHYGSDRWLLCQHHDD